MLVERKTKSNGLGVTKMLNPSEISHSFIHSFIIFFFPCLYICPSWQHQFLIPFPSKRVAFLSSKWKIVDVKLRISVIFKNVDKHTCIYVYVSINMYMMGLHWRRCDIQRLPNYFTNGLFIGFKMFVLYISSLSLSNRCLNRCTVMHSVEVIIEQHELKCFAQE